MEKKNRSKSRLQEARREKGVERTGSIHRTKEAQKKNNGTTGRTLRENIGHKTMPYFGRKKGKNACAGGKGSAVGRTARVSGRAS